MSRTWLHDLKLDQLHRLATLVGSHCSGTKPVRIQGIQSAVDNAVVLTRSGHYRDGDLSLVSIDMGIRNLAYCNIKTPFPNSATAGLDSITLEAWQRVEVAESLASRKPIAGLKKSKVVAKALDIPTADTKESFEPQEYAKYAYSFVKRIIDEHNPSHILIERQRFRSGGGSAVQEWSIRVGVFEAMLYAAIRTLVEQKYCDCTVVPMPPAMVNRFWLNSATDDTPSYKAKQKQGDRVKKQKIQIAGKLFSIGSVDKVPLSLSKAASKTKVDFLAKLSGQKNLSSASIPKLDDMADSLLQGIAWISWQRNRLNLKSLGEKEFNLQDLSES